MALTSYEKILTMAKDAVKEMMAPIRAHEMKKKAELEIAKLDGTIAEKEQKIAELASEYPIDYDKLINALDDLELTKRRSTQFSKIIEEMFSE
jgi:L-asparaginase/Glu-tRNA(Gln) amidotransferase subunit D